MSHQEKLEKLQEALDRNFFRKELSLRKLLNAFPELPEDKHAWLIKDQKDFTFVELKKWLKNFKHAFDETFAEDKRLFAVYCASLEVPVPMWLSKHAKTGREIRESLEVLERSDYPDLFRDAYTEEWVSVSEVSTLFRAKEQSIRKILQETDIQVLKLEGTEKRDPMWGTLFKAQETNALKSQGFDEIKKVFDETHGSIEK